MFSQYYFEKQCTSVHQTKSATPHLLHSSFPIAHLEPLAAQSLFSLSHLFLLSSFSPTFKYPKALPRKTRFFLNEELIFLSHLAQPPFLTQLSPAHTTSSSRPCKGLHTQKQLPALPSCCFTHPCLLDTSAPTLFGSLDLSLHHNAAASLAFLPLYRSLPTGTLSWPLCQPVFHQDPGHAVPLISLQKKRLTSQTLSTSTR